MIPPDDILSKHRNAQSIRDLLLGLKLGGKDIDVPSEWLDEPVTWKRWMERVYHRGRLMDPTRVDRQTMVHSQCHENTTTLFLNGQVPSFATGFALCGDTWYCHSWGLRQDNDGETIVETHQDTFQQYYGAEYTGDEGKDSASGLHARVTMGHVPFSGLLIDHPWEP